MKDHSPLHTEPLYWVDSYLIKFDAKVEIAYDNIIILDKTAFYPVGGGQAADHGIIYLKNNEDVNFKVINVEKSADEIHHFIEGQVSGKLSKGDTIIGVINWERRYNLMRAHTSQHLLSSIIQNRFSIKTEKAVIEEQNVAVYLATSITYLQLKEAINETNLYINSNHKITTEIIDKYTINNKMRQNIRGDIHKIDDEKIRIVSIAEQDHSLCGGTHCRDISEIGFLLLTDFKGDIIYYTFAEEAVKQLTDINLAIIELSKKLASKPEEFTSRVTKIIEEHSILKENEIQLSKIALQNAMKAIKERPIKIGSITILLGDFHYVEKRIVLQELGPLSENVIAVFIIKGPMILFTSSCDNVSAKMVCDAFCVSTNNKGGGSPKIAQASLTDLSENNLAIVLDIIKEKIRELEL
ncbi:MAG: hypothetical protein FK734_12160 [Asgard group archaeon]|nr:hypothetical protein [Asgard group archaeon]